MKRAPTAKDMQHAENDTDGDMGEPKISRQDIWQQQKAMTKENRNREIEDKYTTTWKSPDGNTRRQIDNITNNAKYRNMARKAHRNIYNGIHM